MNELDPVQPEGAKAVEAEPPTAAPVSSEPAPEAEAAVGEESAVDAPSKVEDVADDDPELLELLEAARQNKQNKEKIHLTPEEMTLPPAQKAAILQDKIKQKRLEKERLERLSAEKIRIESQKKMLESRRHLEELEKQRFREQLERERAEKKAQEERQMELLKLEYKERFGVELDVEQLELQKLKRKSARDQCVHWLGKIKELGKSGTYSKEQVTTCLKTLRVYVNNARSNPDVPKYLAINAANKAFQERVAVIPEAVSMLEAAGFVKQPDSDQYAIQGIPNGFVLGECLKFLDFLLASS